MYYIPRVFTLCNIYYVFFNTFCTICTTYFYTLGIKYVYIPPVFILFVLFTTGFVLYVLDIPRVFMLKVLSTMFFTLYVLSLYVMRFCTFCTIYHAFLNFIEYIRRVFILYVLVYTTRRYS